MVQAGACAPTCGTTLLTWQPPGSSCCWQGSCTHRWRAATPTGGWAPAGRGGGGGVLLPGDPWGPQGMALRPHKHAITPPPHPTTPPPPPPACRHDLVDVGREALSKLSTAAWQGVVHAYLLGDAPALATASAQLQAQLTDLDSLLATHHAFLVSQRPPCPCLPLSPFHTPNPRSGACVRVRRRARCWRGRPPMQTGTPPWQPSTSATCAHRWGGSGRHGLWAGAGGQGRVPSACLNTCRGRLPLHSPGCILPFPPFLCQAAHHLGHQRRRRRQ